MDRQGHSQAALELLILKTLAGPNHGFGIALHIEQSSSAMLVWKKDLYPALHRLDKAGFVDAEGR